MTPAALPELQHRFATTSADETQALAERLGRLAAAGDIIALAGDLGAGKTAFVQGLARGLDVRSARVASPSFTIVNEHAGRLPLIHADLYRLADPEELEELGFRDYLGRGAVVAVEWFEQAPAALPRERLEIRLVATAPETRELEVRAIGVTAIERLRAWIGPA
jgi:tRNA threonylcarbamoyladenosine biosynthesis protein TsaE